MEPSTTKRKRATSFERKLIFNSVATAELHKEPCAVIAGGAALALKDDKGWLPTDIDVFCFGPDAAAAAARIVCRMVAACPPDSVVVGVQKSLATIWRKGMLPVQVIATRQSSAVELVSRFDLDIVRVYTKCDSCKPNWFCGTTTNWSTGDCSGNKAPGSVITPGPTADGKTPLRIAKYVRRGYVAPPGMVIPSDAAVDRAEAREVRWYKGMTPLAVAEHAQYLAAYSSPWLQSYGMPALLERLASMEAADFHAADPGNGYSSATQGIRTQLMARHEICALQVFLLELEKARAELERGQSHTREKVQQTDKPPGGGQATVARACT